MSVTIVFRTSGAWGTGKGSRLTKEEGDTNLWNLKQFVEDLEAAIPDLVVSLDTFRVDGSNFYVDLTDGSSQGPFALPVSTWTFREDWVPSTVYNPSDVVLVNSKIYIVLYAHLSDASFDPNANDGLGHNYYQLMIDLGSAAIPSGGTTGQVLAKTSDTNYDVGWVDQTGGGGGGSTLDMTIEYLSTEKIVGGDLAVSPSGWTLNDNVWTTGALDVDMATASDPSIQIPLTGLSVGEWYLVEFTGYVSGDVNYFYFTTALGFWVFSGNGSFIFQAGSTSDTLNIDLFFYLGTGYRTLNSISCRQISATEAVTISNGVNPVMKLGYDPGNLFWGEDAAPWLDLTPMANPPMGSIGLGAGAMANATYAYGNIAIGRQTLMNNEGGGNVAIGDQTLLQATGDNNIALGMSALYRLTYGDNNVSIAQAMARLEGGYNNIGIGYDALFSGVTISYNVGIGTEALYRATTNDNTAVGYHAGYVFQNGSHNTFLGSGADASSSASITNSMALGYNAKIPAATDNFVQFGDSNVVAGRIGTKYLGAPGHALINGGAAGNFTCTGVETVDRLDEVIYYPASGLPQDLTSEFTINASNNITNSGGTATTSGKLLVRWTNLH